MKKVKKIYAYFHAGSSNHGCEAIVRSTQLFLSNKIALISSDPESDELYGLDKIVEIESKKVSCYTFVEKIICFIAVKFFNNEKFSYKFLAKHECKDIKGSDIALSIGGDNYCYGNAYNFHLAGLNQYLHKNGLKTVLWGCSIEPSTITKSMNKDFSKYDLITARECISYEYLKKINSKTILICDPAFHLKKEELPLPINFIEGKTIGINISPLIQKSESKDGITLINYVNMIDYILKNTDYQIALIPHVVCDGNDDRVPLSFIFEKYKETNRIVLIDDCNCEQLKGYISRCCLFIGARTHATIAAYSTYVPTLVIGYSTKAKGIAIDLFGTDKNYVLPVQSLNGENDMTKAFMWLNKNKLEIHEHLKSYIPQYKERINAGIKALERL